MAALTVQNVAKTGLVASYSAAAALRLPPAIS